MNPTEHYIGEIKVKITKIINLGMKNNDYLDFSSWSLQMIL